MEEIEFLEKIDILITSMNYKINELKKQKDSYHERYNAIAAYKSDYKQYQLDLYRTNYYMIKIDNEIKRNEAYIKRCSSYLQYLKSLDSGNEFIIKQKAYEFIKTFQEEAINYYYNLIKEFDSLVSLQKIANHELTANLEREKAIAKRNKIFEIFTKGKFQIKDDELYTNSYLNYEIDKTIKKLYAKKTKKVA